MRYRRSVGAMALICIVASTGCQAKTPGEPEDGLQVIGHAESRANRSSVFKTRFRVAEYAAAIYNAGSTHPFVIFNSVHRDTQISSNSTAHITITVSAPSRFASTESEQNWRAVGRPSVLPVLGMTRRGVIRSYSFLPQGIPLGYRAANDLPSVPSALRNVIETRLYPVTGKPVPTTLMLKSYAYLLALAPLSPGTRKAVYENIASLKEVHSCGDDTDQTGRHGDSICVQAHGRETKVLFSPQTGRVLAVELRLTEPSPLFPGLPAGSLVEASAFLSD